MCLLIPLVVAAGVVVYVAVASFLLVAAALVASHFYASQLCIRCMLLVLVLAGLQIKRK